MDKENLRELLSQIRQEDTRKLRELHQQIELQLQRSGITHVEDVLFWIHVSKQICDISYKKKSIKDRYKDVPWHQLEFLHKVLSTYLHAKYVINVHPLDKEQRLLLNNLQTEDFLLDDKSQLPFLVELCEFAWNSIHPIELVELRDRFSEILEEEQQRVTTKEGTQQYQWKQHVPPAYGLVSVCKLSGYFLDHHELQTILVYSKQAIQELQNKKTISKVEEKFGVLRVLAIIGESTKYLTLSTKDIDPSVPWKNVEKIRDLLSHVSRLPMRQAVNLVLEMKDPPHIARLLDEVRSQINQQTQEKPAVPSKKKNKNQHDESAELLFKISANIAIVLGCLFIFICLLVWKASTGTLEHVHGAFWMGLLTLIGMLLLALRKRQQVLKQIEQKKRFFKKLQQIDSEVETPKIPPPNLLNRMALRDLPQLHHKIHRILRIHQSIRYYLIAGWVLYLPIVLVPVLFILERPFTYAIECIKPNLLVYLLPAWFLKTFFTEQPRPVKDVWNLIPAPPSKPSAQIQIPEIGEVEEQVKEEPVDDRLFQYFSAADKPRYLAIWNSEIQLSQEDKKRLLSQVTEKSHRKLWSEKLFYMKPKLKPSKSSETSKEKRLQKFLEIHENSTLNREYGLESFIELRSFLQLPAEDKLSVKDVCVPLALEAISTLEQLIVLHNMQNSIQPDCNQQQIISLLQNNVLLHHTLEYFIGLYALYAAQIKWHYPTLLGNEHMEIRDHFMHGTNHSYSSHFTAEGISHSLKQIGYILLEVKPRLESLRHVQ